MGQLQSRVRLYKLTGVDLEPLDTSVHMRRTTPFVYKESLCHAGEYIHLAASC
jgi:hypothetical protein